MRVAVAALLGLATAGCGAAQEEPRGQVFCESYENAFVGQCRQSCEATTDGKPDEVGQQCLVKCEADLADDDTFADSCGPSAAR